MSITRQTSDALAKRLAAIPSEVKARVTPALVKSANEVADKARTLAEASRRSGGLIESIEVTEPGQTTPAYAEGGQTAQAGELQALVTVGNKDNRHGHLVEFGTDERQHADGTSTGKMPARPFLLPAWRLSKTRVERRIQAALRRGIKDAVAAGHGGNNDA